jgi:EAL domain-containing protein (putative c-di-GMP-specific phosphodiesterase class I)
MSQESLETVRAMYRAFSGLAEGGDLASYVAAHRDPDCEYQPVVEEHEPVRGHEALVRWHERWFEALEETPRRRR